MQTEASKQNWNELQWLSWGEFQQMAPAILQLEVDKMQTILQDVAGDTDWRNNVVRARFAVRKFIACLADANKDTIVESCCPHLRIAIMSLSIQPDNLGTKTRDTCGYVIDRLTYIHDRIRLIY